MAHLTHLRASPDTRHIGASVNGGAITLWRTDQSNPIATVDDPRLDSASRYAIDAQKTLLYLGTWEDGLTCFNYSTGRVVWRRRDLMGIQSVQISAAFSSSIFLTVAADDHTKLRWRLLSLLSLGNGSVPPGVAELDARTGKTLWTCEDGHWLFLHPAKPIIVMENQFRDRVRILNRDKMEIGTAPMANFAIIDIAFSEHSMALAEGSEGVRVIAFDGAVISEYCPKDREANCIRIAFDGSQLCVHDSWESSIISLLDPSAGTLIREYARANAGDIRFVDGGSRFVDQTGAIHRSDDGSVVFTLVAP